MRPSVPGRQRLVVLLAMAGSLLMAAAAAAQMDHEQHEHQHTADTSGPGLDGQILCLICPASRESAGTSWQPDDAATHQHDLPVGEWHLRVHVQLTAMYTDEGGPRGGDGAYALDHVMAGARRAVGSGVVSVQTMWSLEPLMGARGYPLLGQTGETADGVTPLIDRQHPHDLPMELAVTYARPMGADRSFFLYVAPVGEPALGPPPFMHRPSAAWLPLAPDTHHWFDSTHVSFGVVTAGVVLSPRAKIEGSAFRGREPDSRRWGFESPRLDSFSFRVSVNPTPALALQVSAGVLHEPEQLHPGADEARFTASAMYSRRWHGVGLDATIGWAQNRRSTYAIPVEGGALRFQGVTSPAAFGEATMHLASRHAVIGRAEYVRKDELFPLLDPRHGLLFPVSRATAAYLFDLAAVRQYKMAVGAAGSWTRVRGLEAEYGGPPRSLLAFLEIGPR